LLTKEGARDKANGVWRYGSQRCLGRTCIAAIGERDEKDVESKEEIRRSKKDGRMKGESKTKKLKMSLVRKEKGVKKEALKKG